MTTRSLNAPRPSTFLVVCTRNRREHLFNLFRNLVSCEPKPEIAIVVDSSDNPLSEFEVAILARELGIPISYLTSGPGLPYQRNVAIDFISRELLPPSFVAFLDDDVEVPDDYFSLGAKLLAANSELVGVGAFDINYAGTPNNLLRRMLWLSSNGSSGQLLRSGIATLRPPKSHLELTTWMPGHSVVFRWEPLRKTRFDASVRMYGEDVEMQLRALEHGKLAMSKDFWVRHFPSSLNREQLRTINAYSDGFRWKLAITHPSRVSKFAVVLTTLTLYTGEIARSIGRLDKSGLIGAQGHLDFLKRLLSGAEVEQLR